MRVSGLGTGNPITGCATAPCRLSVNRLGWHRICWGSRHMRQSQWLEEILVDLRHSVRAFRRNPVFVLAALGCLALGIGANILIFSLVNSILLRSLPYPNADQLAMVRFTPPNQPDQKLGTNPGSYFFIRQHNSVFQSMGALRITGFSVATESGDSGRQWIQGGWVSLGLTDTMGVRPMMGRWFAREDTVFTIVISYGLWQRLYGGSKDVLSKKLFLDAAPATIVGVMPVVIRR
jgi:MacB-like periplasmic core domain